ncbi:hypothetical protein CU098_007584, partial [Rhizopus stolonifer]
STITHTTQFPKWNIIQTTNEQQDHLKVIQKLESKLNKAKNKSYAHIVSHCSDEEMVESDDEGISLLNNSQNRRKTEAEYQRSSCFCCC